MRPVFLSADWRHLVLLNYQVEPRSLARHLPRGTELDLVDGAAYVSLVAFLFQKTSLFGRIPALFHREFEEINLRFYVRRETEGTVRRGVVFIKEIVPKALLAYIARVFYSENYIHMPTSSRIDCGREYRYDFGSHSLTVRTGGRPADRRSGYHRAIFHRALLGIHQSE